MTPAVWMTVNEASAYLRVERTTLYLYCRRGLLPFYEMPMGRGRRFRQEDLDALLSLSVPSKKGDRSQ